MSSLGGALAEEVTQFGGTSTDGGGFDGGLVW